MARRKRARKPPVSAPPRAPGGQTTAAPSRRDTVWAWALGLLFAIVILKWGGAIVLNDRVTAPRGLAEWLLNPWPYPSLLPLAFGGIAVAAWWTFGKPRPDRVTWLLLGWWAWQGVAWLGSEDRALSGLVWGHATCALGAWFLGRCALARFRAAQGFWIPVLAAFGLVLGSGFLQHYGGKEEMRAFVERHERTGWKDLPAEQLQALVASGALMRQPDGSYGLHEEYRKRLESDRICGTMGGYPNALAGLILLLGPPLALGLWGRVQATGHRGALAALAGSRSGRRLRQGDGVPLRANKTIHQPEATGQRLGSIPARRVLF